MGFHFNLIAYFLIILLASSESKNRYAELSIEMKENLASNNYAFGKTAWSSSAERFRSTLKSGSPSLVFVGIIVCFIVICLLYMILFAKCCGRCSRRNVKGYKSRQLVISAVFFCISVAIIIFSSILGFTSTSAVQLGTEHFTSSVVSLKSDIQLFTSVAPYSIINDGRKIILNNLHETFFNFTHEVKSNFEFLKADELIISEKLSFISGNLSLLLQSAEECQNQLSKIEKLATSLKNDVEPSVEGKLQILNSVQDLNGVVEFQLKTPVDGTELLEALRNLVPNEALENLPNVPSMFGEMQENFPDFGEISKTFGSEYGFSFMENTISDFEFSFSSKVTNQTNALIETGKLFIDDAKNTIFTMVDSSEPVLNMGIAALRFLGTTSKILFYCLFFIAFLQGSLYILLLYTEKPLSLQGSVKSKVITLSWLLLLLFGLLQFIFATVVGESCDLINPSNPPQSAIQYNIETSVISKSNLSIDNIVSMVQDFLPHFQTSCYQNKDLITMLQTWKFINITGLSPNDLDMHAQLEKFLNVDDFISQLLSNININTVNFPDYSKASDSLQDKNLIESINELKNHPAINIEIPILDSFETVQNFIKNLENKQWNLDPKSDYIYNPVSAPTLNSSIPDLIQKINFEQSKNLKLDIEKFIGKRNSVSAQISYEREIFLAKVEKLQMQLDVLKNIFDATLDQFKSNINKVNIEIENIPNLISNSVPVFENLIFDTVEALQKLAKEKLECRSFALDLYAMENSICEVTLSGLDGTWLSCIVLGLTFLFSVPVMIIAANRLGYNKVEILALEQQNARKDEEEKVIDKEERENLIQKSSPKDNENTLKIHITFDDGNRIADSPTPVPAYASHESTPMTGLPKYDIVVSVPRSQRASEVRAPHSQESEVGIPQTQGSSIRDSKQDRESGKILIIRKILNLYF
ncbi:hypothetical protein HDU92_005521 [Lobulomyces angularis]|nr:hypothetical protein HDU92_005521 [Lobulomyces angularis]